MKCKTVFKQLNIIVLLAKTYVLKELTFWFLTFRGIGKEQPCPHCDIGSKGHRKGKEEQGREGTNVLKEGKQFLFKFFQREEGKNSVDHLTGSKEEGEGREEVGREGKKGTGPSMGILDPSMGIREEGEGREWGEERDKAIFEVREDGKSWICGNILLEIIGPSAFLVKVNPVHIKEIGEEGEGEDGKGEEEIWEGPDTIVCYTPNILALFELFNYLRPGCIPLFASSAEYKPLA